MGLSAETNTVIRHLQDIRLYEPAIDSAIAKSASVEELARSVKNIVFDNVTKVVGRSGFLSELVEASLHRSDWQEIARILSK